MVTRRRDAGETPALPGLGGLDLFECPGESEHFFGREVFWLARCRERMMDGPKQSWIHGVLAGARFLDHFFPGKYGRVSRNIIMDAEEQFGLPNGFTLVRIAIGKILDDARIVRAAGLGLTDVSESARILPFADRFHRLEVVGEFLVRIPNLLCRISIHAIQAWPENKNVAIVGDYGLGSREFPRYVRVYGKFVR